MASDTRECGRSLEEPYTREEIDRILEKLEPRKEFSRKDCVAECEWIARWAISAQQGATTIPPSERAAFFAALAGAAGRLNQSLGRLPPHQEYLIQAAHNMADLGVPPPGAQVEFVEAHNPATGDPEPPMGFWNVEERLEANLADLRCLVGWLQRCAALASEYAEAEKTKPGNRRPEWLELAVGGFMELYRQISARPATAHKHRDEGEAQGTLVDLLECALPPLGFDGDRMAILRLVQGIKKQPAPPIVRIGHRENQ
jgi:hypothetical protein